MINFFRKIRYKLADNNHFILLNLFILFCVCHVFGQETKVLFQSDDILKLTIKLPVKELIHDLEERHNHKAVLSYVGDNNEESIHEIKLKVRGKSRSDIDVCKFPPLEINFNKNKTKNTLFEGQNKLKLVTHCNYGSEFSRYVVEEYTIYKMYQIVSPYSYNVRLCEITYVDLDERKKPFKKIGFLIEQIKDVAKRNNMVIYRDSIRNQDMCNRKELDKLMVFQYMIGNLDWEIKLRHNIKLIAPEERAYPLAVPYDFDYAGIINTSYSAVPEELGFNSTKTRLFRGFCRFNNGYNITLEYYQQIKPDLLNLVSTSDYLNEKNKKSFSNYLASFYKILDNPKQVNRNIITACRVKHKHLY